MSIRNPRSVDFFFYRVYAFHEKKNHIEIFCLEIWAEVIFDWPLSCGTPLRWLALLFVEMSLNGQKERLTWHFTITFRSQIENQVNSRESQVCVDLKSKMATIAGHCLKIGTYRKMKNKFPQKLLIWSNHTDFNKKNHLKISHSSEIHSPN